MQTQKSPIARLWRRRHRTVAASLVGLALVTAALAGEAAATDSVARPVTTAAATPGARGNSAAPTTDADSAPGDDLEYDETRTLRLGLETGFLGWDPVTSVAGRDPEVLFLVYDRLVHVDPDDGSLVPGLATEWSFADDNSYLELILREGVEFHDGTPFDAEAVKANLDRAMTLEGSARKADLDSIDSVDIIDDYTVHLMLNAPSQTLPTVLSNREGAMVSPTLFNADPEFGEKTAVGTGPFVLESNELSISAKFVKNEDYWNADSVHLAGIDLTVMADSTTRLNAIRSGELDLVGVTSAQIGDAENAGLTVTARSTTQLYMIYINRSLEPMDDVRVRQAINYAIDKEQIVEFLLFGEAQVASQFFNDFDPAHVADLEGSYQRDPDKARELLAEAGYPDGFTITATTYSERPFELQLATVIQSQLAEVGITLELLPLDRSAIIETFFQNAETHIFPALFTGRNTPEQAAGALFSDGGSLNSGNVVDDAVQAAFDAAAGAATEEDRAAALQTLGQIISDEALTVPVAFNDVAFVSTAEVQNISITQAGQLDVVSTGFAP